ncbi:hypothetical protein ASPFODRAFT_64746 [Aspergillus luchuensis CBS 106.47]|uniref:non-specific serine/threonine protein kinase n=1 Tax=Aspergillus luchuensis (strain CBS 106.47) TaxID=1137211 RepID=A0A1M3T5E3_ASPLC|nr:hypothetical protein ASPFODRAFT_64746 [Aspergillus luchuensis CBS 106.47]
MSRNFPPSGFKLLDSSLRIEEETLPTYQAQKYYPIQQGEIFNNRYQVLAKIGYGVTSTVWFGRDLVNCSYVALKIYVTGEKRDHELNIYRHMNSAEFKHPGKSLIRKLLDHFIITGRHGQHICLVHEPLGISASELLRSFPGNAVTLEDMKVCIRQLLIALDFLHSVAGVIHTDLQLKNLLLPTPKPKALFEFEEEELRMPSARKVLQDRTIYKSSRFPPGDGLPLLSDFGEARLGDEEHNEDIMPDPYRAPEVILRENWDYKDDIGVHLSSVLWDNSGTWKGLAPVPDITLESLAIDIRGEDKDGFLRWIRRALQWNSSDRPTALELFFSSENSIYCHLNIH